MLAKIKSALLASGLAVVCVGFISSSNCSAQMGPAIDPVSPAANRPIKDKWAVIIGISDFASPVIPKLQYPAKDAQDFYDFLTTTANFKKDHILLLKNQQASKDRILDAFGDNWLPRRVMKDDLVVIFLSSHGSSADIAGENFIIAYDTDPNRPYATGIRFQDLASEVTKRTGCDRLVLLLDACHSGAAVQGEKGLVRVGNFNLDDVTGTGQLVISSSSPQQTSWESKRYPNGVFTRKLIEAMQVKGNSTTVSDAFKHLQDSVEQEVHFDRVTDQTPMMLSKWNGEDLELSAVPAEPRTVLPEVKDEELIYTMPANKPAPVVNSEAPHLVANPSHIAVSLPPKTHPSQIAPAQTTSALAGHPMMWTTWNANGGDVTLESGTRLIQPSELQSMSKKDLLLLYNEAYARHGRGFVTREIQQAFDAQFWYRMDPDYHFRPEDPRVIARKGPDDSLIVNERRTPKQWANMQTIKFVMDKK